MMPIRIGEQVRIRKFPKNSPDAYGRIVAQRKGEFWVSNMNMPYYGTTSEWFREDELEFK